MAGMYIHIPFCRKACIYCDFHFSTTLKRKPEMVQAICKEIEMQRDFLPHNQLSSIYFGGGTPSVLDQDELLSIFDTINRFFKVDESAEITLEANPDDLTAEKLQQLSSSPVNRLSIGIQSFRNEDLILMNRSHSARQALQCVAAAQENGFENITIDLIYGIPSMDDESWKQQIQTAVNLEVSHISSYALTVESGTVLHHKISKGEMKPLDENSAANQFSILQQELSKAGFRQYEVSNFAIPGFEAKHNSSYWSGQSYLGIGPSAHSFKENLRQWNISNNAVYIDSIRSGKIPAEQEGLSGKDRFNERIMTSLRLIGGIDLLTLEEEFGPEFMQHLQDESKELLASGKLVQKNNRMFIPSEFRFFSDGIAAELFYIDS